MNSYIALSLVCLLTVQALPTKEQNIVVANTSNRQLGFCCGDVSRKCAIGCAGKSCDIRCSGTCGIFGTTCSYTCSQVTNACTTATTAAATTTTAAATTTTTACIATGSLCLSITEGSKGTCCSGGHCICLWRWIQLCLN